MWRLTCQAIRTYIPRDIGSRQIFLASRQFVMPLNRGVAVTLGAGTLFVNSRHRNTYSAYRFRRAPQRLRFETGASSLASLIVALILVTGCGGSIEVPTGNAENIEPGVLYTVSIESLPPPPATNLIENGDFAEWQPGAAAPDFFLPPDPGRGFSTIEPAERESPESKGVKQIWTSSDSVEAYTKVFRYWLTDLRPNTTYHLTVRVNNPSPKEIFLRAFQYNTRSAAEAENSTERPPTLAGIAIGQTEGFEEFSTEFKTGPQEVFCVLLAPKLRSPEGNFPSHCIWDSWQLTEVVGAPQSAVQ